MKTTEQTSTRDLLAMETGASPQDYELEFSSSLRLSGGNVLHLSIYYGAYEAAHIVVSRMNKESITYEVCQNFEIAAKGVSKRMIRRF